jgi:hypothetical protein
MSDVHNTSDNLTFEQVLQARLSRRHLLKGGFYLMTASVLGAGLSGCDTDGKPVADVPAQSLALTFKPVDEKCC